MVAPRGTRSVAPSRHRAIARAASPTRATIDRARAPTMDDFDDLAFGFEIATTTTGATATTTTIRDAFRHPFDVVAFATRSKSPTPAPTREDVEREAAAKAAAKAAARRERERRRSARRRSAQTEAQREAERLRSRRRRVIAPAVIARRRRRVRRRLPRARRASRRWRVHLLVYMVYVSTFIWDSTTYIDSFARDGRSFAELENHPPKIRRNGSEE
jgi:hypothetical protein